MPVVRTPAHLRHQRIGFAIRRVLNRGPQAVRPHGDEHVLERRAERHHHRHARRIGHRQRALDGDCKAESLRTHSNEAHRVDADYLSAAIQQRSAAVPRVDRRVGLNQRYAVGLSNRADDASRDGIGEGAQRVADRDDFLARTHVGRRPEAQDPLLRIWAVHLKHREIDRDRRRDDTSRVLRTARI